MGVVSPPGVSGKVRKAGTTRKIGISLRVAKCGRRYRTGKESASRELLGDWVMRTSASGRARTGLSTALRPRAAVTMALARRFRIAPNTASRLLRTHAALGGEALTGLPAKVEVAAVDGLGAVKIDVAGSYPLKDARKAHEDLEGRKTTGSLILIP